MTAEPHLRMYAAKGLENDSEHYAAFHIKCWDNRDRNRPIYIVIGSRPGPITDTNGYQASGEEWARVVALGAMSVSKLSGFMTIPVILRFVRAVYLMGDGWGYDEVLTMFPDARHRTQGFVLELMEEIRKDADLCEAIGMKPPRWDRG